MGSSRCLASTKRNPCTTGTGLSERSTFTKRSSPHPPPPEPVVDEGGEVTGGDNLPLKKEEDEAVAYGGAQDPEAKPEEEQEAVPYGGAPEPEVNPEDKQEPADPREALPARGEPLLTQKGPEANVATGGGTGCGCVLHGAVPCVIAVPHVRL